jgi:hypothetical protein
MRLGTLKYGQAFHLDLSQKGTSSGGSRIRVRLWQCLLKNGVEIVVLSEIGKAHWEAFKALQKRFPKQLTYRPFGHTKDLDVLLVECGPTNTTFAGKDHIPYIVLANKVIAGMTLTLASSSRWSHLESNLISCPDTTRWRPLWI